MRSQRLRRPCSTDRRLGSVPVVKVQPWISEGVSSLAAELRGKPAAWALTAGLKRLPAERWENGAVGAGTASGAARPRALRAL